MDSIEKETKSNEISESERIRWLQDDAIKSTSGLDIVISGMSGRFPKSNSINEYEHNFRNGIDMILDNDNARYQCGLFGLPPRAGRLPEIDRFDYEFFGYSLKDVKFLDVQLRLLYEVVYESLLDAGINPSQLRGCKRTGVYASICFTSYETEVTDKSDDATIATIQPYHGQLSLKVANYFDIRGPNMNSDAACASSAVGFAEAVQAIEQGVIDRAIVCATNVQMHPGCNLHFLLLGMLSPGGHSRFMDAKADGYVKAECVCSIVLERSKLAKRNYAQVLASDTTSDGYKLEGITFPSSKAQEQLLRSMKRRANVNINHVEYIEAHGTGTPVGDPVEVKGIASVYAPISTLHEQGKEKGQRQHVNYNMADRLDVDSEKRFIGPLYMASSKSSVGHSESAAFLASTIKVLLMMENEIIYKSLSYDEPNPRIEPLVAGRVKVLLENAKLNAKVVPISCYGFGGSDVHIILKSCVPAIEYPIANRKSGESISMPRLVTMFGRGSGQLERFFDRLLDSNSIYTRNCLSDDFLHLLDTLNSTHVDRLMNYRGYMIVDQFEQKSLERKVAKMELKRVKGRSCHLQDSEKRLCNLVFGGLGSDWPQMAAGLKGFSPFWSTIDRLSRGCSLISDLVENGCQIDKLESKFAAIIGYEIALLNIVRDQAKVANLAKFTGHSIGEVTCAYARGLIDEHAALRIASEMGKTLDENQELCAGKMVALMMDLDEANKLIDSQSNAKTIRVSCINGPLSVTVSGSHKEMDKLCEDLESKSIWYKVIEERVALHNTQIMGAKVQQHLQQRIEKVLNESVPCWTVDNWAPSMSVDCAKLRRMSLAEYLAECMCKPVEFLQAIESFDKNSIVLEASPSGLFESQVKLMSSSKLSSRFTYVKMMQHSTPSQEQAIKLLKSLGDLYLAGAIMDFVSFNAYFNIFGSRVRRQTPSLSSLIEWNHDETMFVPRHPQYFVLDQSNIKIDFEWCWDELSFMSDHQVEGRALFPATGYIYYAWKHFSNYKTSSSAQLQSLDEMKDVIYVPVEMRQVNFHRAVMITKQTKLMFKLDTQTGLFQFLDSDTIVCDGYVQSPVDRPDELLYEPVRKEMQQELRDSEMVMSHDDIYRQFRVRGHDYGEHFSLIQRSSNDGRKSFVSYRKHFASFADACLQTTLWAQMRYPMKSMLSLVRSIDYLRINPSLLIEKLEYCGLPIVEVRSLNTKQEMMSMIRSENEQANESAGVDEAIEETEAQQKEKDVTQTKKLDVERNRECLFEVYTDLKLNVVITNGFEFRGLNGSSAPNKQTEVTVLKYEFVDDFEVPISNEHEVSLKLELYNRVCDQLTLEWLKIATHNGSTMMDDYSRAGSNEDTLITRLSILSNSTKDAYFYMNKLLRCTDDNSLDAQTGNESESTTSSPEVIDHKDLVKKNGDKVMLSMLNIMLSRAYDIDEAKKMIIDCKRYLENDMLHNLGWQNDRLLAPFVADVSDNLYHNSKSLSILEVNHGMSVMFPRIEYLLSSSKKDIEIQYSLVHPEELAKDIRHTLSKQISENKIRIISANLDIEDIQLKQADLIIYKDQSCYLDSKKLNSNEDLAKDVQSHVERLRSGGFLLVTMKTVVSLAEWIMLLMMENQQLLEDTIYNYAENRTRVNHSYSMRSVFIENHLTQTMGFECLSKKCDNLGNLMMLFKKPVPVDTNEQGDDDMIVLRVTHEDPQEIENWLEELKANFGYLKSSEDEDYVTDWDTEDEDDDQARKHVVEPKVAKSSHKKVWLCAIATKHHQINGLVGFMMSLRAELGSQYLRCYYDMHSFKDASEPISLHDITSCDKFKFAKQRDIFWNCVNVDGHFGSFRHFETHQELKYDHCKTDEQPLSYKNRISTTSEYPNEGEYADLSIKGDLSSFTWFGCPHKHLTQEQSCEMVAVSYSAINFKDIMIASGRLPTETQPMKVVLFENSLGFEYSGYHMGSGKRVMGMTIGRGLATRIVASQDTTTQFEVPHGMSMREAATLPVVYLTAIMALKVRGQMKRGESILIHAASGGVGQAAMHLCAHHGVQIYATVGTEEKRDFLLKEFGHYLEGSRIYSSRDCNFEHQIMTATKGRGVDLILNSLSGDILQASIRCLADGGRFLEIGKYDLMMDKKIELLFMNTNKSYQSVLLDKIYDRLDITPRAERLFEQMFRIFQDGLDEGFVKPIKSTVFKRNQIEEAFRFMAQGKHIGKVLIEMNDPEMYTKGWEPQIQAAPRIDLSPLKTYIVTGGLGGFGLELCKLLVRKGVRKLLITSRQGKMNAYQKASLEIMRDVGGCEVQVATASMANTVEREGCKKLLEMAVEMSTIGQIGGIFHLAMVLRDCLIENMKVEDFEVVCKPKLDTGIHLDELTQSMNLQVDYFVCFSSASSGKGNIGQCNYSYANSGLERLCERRRLKGLHGLAIQWGAIGDVGFVYDHMGGNNVVIAGTTVQRIPSCMDTLGKMIGSPFSVCSSHVSVNSKSDLFSDGDFTTSIMNIMGIKDQSKVDEQARLSDLGLDSLMAVEIRHYIEKKFDKTLSVQEVRNLRVCELKMFANDSKKITMDQDKKLIDDPSKSNVEVVGYGQLGNIATADDGQPSELVDASNRSTNDEGDYHIRYDGDFKPGMQTPKEPFEFLSRDTDIDWSNAHKRPIFVLPPVYGSFELIEPICKQISRPCVGINWTEELCSTSDIQTMIGSIVQLIECFISDNNTNSSKTCHEPHCIDIIGYSYGATIGYEVMAKILNNSTKIAKGNVKLVAGSLVLLDTTPRVVEHASNMVKLFAKVSLIEHLSSFLLPYINANKSKKVNMSQVQKKFSKVQNEDQLVEKTSRIIESQMEKKMKLRNNHGGDVISFGDIKKTIRAYLNRCAMFKDYWCNKTIPIDCLLIRSEKFVYASAKGIFGQDLGLSTLISGRKPQVVILQGDHSSFLRDNIKEIALNIDNFTMLSRGSN